MIGTPTVTINSSHLDIIYARAKFFLWRKRHVENTERWFTINEIAAHFSKRPSADDVIVAIGCIAATNELERWGNRVRHVRRIAEAGTGTS